MSFKALLVALLTVGAAIFPALHALASPADELCGTWILVDRIDRTADGKILVEPSLGSDPLGILVYDMAGNVSVQLMKRSRADIHRDGSSPSQPSAQASNNSTAENGYDAYFGKYAVDLNAHTVTHQLTGAIAVSDVGKSVTRHFELIGNELHLRFDTTNNGVPVQRTLRWQRASAPNNSFKPSPLRGLGPTGTASGGPA